MKKTKHCLDKKSSINIWKTPVPYIISFLLVAIGIVSIIYSLNILELKNRIDYSYSDNTGEISDFDDNLKKLNNSDKSGKKSSENKENQKEKSNQYYNEEYVYYGDSKESKSSKGLYKAMKEYNEDLITTQVRKITDTKSFEGPFIKLSDYGFDTNCVGYISISSINIKLPIYLGADKENLSLGAGHLNCTSAPIGGINTNCVICAHNYDSAGITSKNHFNSLPKIKVGDKIKITNFWETLTYKVVETKRVVQNESSLLYIEEGKDICTLFTCVKGKSKDYDRFFVISERCK